MTNLTEQWKKGELQKGWYYVKLIPDFEYPDDIAFYTGEYFELYSDEDIEQVLAPVPSYEEYQQLKEYERIVTSYNMKPIDYEIACETVNKLLDEKKALKEENTKLKELLKECQGSIATLLSKKITEVNGIKQEELLAKISEALGEE